MGSPNELVVVKYGSSSVANEAGMDALLLNHYATELVTVKKQYDLIVVSSGSIAVGRALWGNREPLNNGEEFMQTLATIGSGRAFTEWQFALANHGLMAGQLLVTHHEIDDKDEGNILRKAISANLEADVINIINENDALSTEELRRLSYGGDNDRLAAHIARSVGANTLCLMTDVEGLLDDNGAPISTVTVENSLKAIELAGGAGISGRGGMKSKVESALLAARGGVEAHIAHAGAHLLDVIRGRVGTSFSVQ